VPEPILSLPAEWARQDAVLLTWPHAQSDWKPWLTEVEPVFVAIAREVAKRETLIVSCHDEPHKEHVRSLLNDAGVTMEAVYLYTIPSNDTWVRDHGPITVRNNGKPQLLDFTFNGWGCKHKHDLDNLVSRRLHQAGAFNAAPLESLELVLEGGAIDSDGEGTLLTTSECMFSPKRNPEYDQAGYETLFAKLFGIKQVLWLEHGQLEGDDTDGHVDTLARFTDPHTIAYVSCDDESDSHYPELAKMKAQLETFRDRQGKPYQLVPLPLPAPICNDEGDRLPATHANFLIINGAVLVPIYDDPSDAISLENLRGCFPDREIVAINCNPLIQQYGSLHCVTMQLPAGVLGNA
jgi:agmatine deiminase